jgi:serine protease AprX
MRRRRTLPLLYLTATLLTIGAVDAVAAQRGGRPGRGFPGVPGPHVKGYKLDDEVARRASRGNPHETSSVIVTLVPGAELPPQFQRFARGGRLGIINGQVLELPNGLIRQLAAHPAIFRVHDNRGVATHNSRTAGTVGARYARDWYGLTGTGVGVAVIDSGIATFHDDLTVGLDTTHYPYGDQRVAKFVDFVDGQTLPYDDNGHGTHVAGTIAGNGYDSYGKQAGIAPHASIVALKVLDAEGRGTIGHLIAALDWVAANATTHNIRVVNMSVGAPIRESYWTDPLTLATKALTDRDIVVVAAAGNFGRNAAGQSQWGGITAPGNAPWVLTVGASSTEGTRNRSDDVLAGFSSRGPTFVDWVAKPDLVAPGTGVVSLAAPGSTFFTQKASALVNGSFSTAYAPYLALSGTSMAAPVVSGTVALMLQANPSLTPNLVKAILQYTAQTYPGYQPLEQGAGFLNTIGAVRLALFYANAQAGDVVPTYSTWSHHILWGSHRLTGGIMVPSANAWRNDVVWGSALTGGVTGQNIVWGTMVLDADNIVWGTAQLELDNIVWGTVDADNIVWGTVDLDNIVWGTTILDADNIVWGTAGVDNIVWGTDCGGADCANVVWGSVGLDNIVWGTAVPGDNIVWGTALLDGDNIVWGTLNADNIVWGTNGGDVTWGSNSVDAGIFPPDEEGESSPDLAGELGGPLPAEDNTSSVTAGGS